MDRNESLLSLIADMNAQIRALQAETQELRQQLAEPAQASPASETRT